MLSASSSSSAACGSCRDVMCVTTRQPQHLPPALVHTQPLPCSGETKERARSCPGCMDTMPTHRHLLPRNFSCTAVLYGESPDTPEDDDVPDGEEEALEKNKEPSKPVTPRGREVTIVPQSPTARRRAKSLPTPAERRHLEVVVPRKKEVRFADSLGLELTSVRHFSDAEMPRVPYHVLAGLRCREACPAGAELSTLLLRAAPGSTHLEPLFANPVSRPDYLELVRQRRVCLETLQTDLFSISGDLRVLNLSYEKEVAVRFSVDSWKTSNEVAASFQRGFSDRYTDRFSFKLLCPMLLNKEGVLEFAIRYRVCGAEYWDNNDGENYKVKSHRAMVSPPKELDSAWIHFI